MLNVHPVSVPVMNTTWASSRSEGSFAPGCNSPRMMRSRSCWAMRRLGGWRSLATAPPRLRMDSAQDTCVLAQTSP